VERTDNSSLEDAPKPLNRLGMDSANNVLALGMVNGGVRESHDLCQVRDNRLRMRSKVLKQKNLMLRSERLEAWATCDSLGLHGQYEHCC
jgi:hypothetical protein